MALRSCSGFYDTPRLRRAIDAWVEQKRQEAALALDRVKAVGFFDSYWEDAVFLSTQAGKTALKWEKRRKC